MAMFRVTWEIDLEADTADEAATEAREIQLDDMSQTTVFTLVNEDTGEKHEVDVGVLTPCKFCRDLTPTNGGRYHEGQHVCSRCWDERFRVTG